MKVLTIALLMLCSIIQAQTVVIAKKTKDAVYVAADSRQVITKTVHYSDQDTSWEKQSDSAILACKIISEGKFNVAFEGWGLFSTEPLTRQYCRTSSTFTELMNTHADNYLPVLMKELQSYKSKYPAAYSIDAPKFKSNIATIFFFGYENDKPFLGVNDYRLVIDEFLNIKEITVAMRAGDLYAHGHIKEIRDTLFSKNVWADGIEKTMNRLIEMQIKNHPDAVGLPIDILKVTSKGREWIQRKENCN